MNPRNKLLVLVLVGLALPLFAWLATPEPRASAQCGTRASSCKTCHEVQGKYRVNTQGDWHIQHSFGDFCVFCHAGNVQAKDKAKAHAGMVKPLDDVDASCAVCHDADCNTRAEKYAKVLGVTVGQGSGGASAPRGGAPFIPLTARIAGTGDITSTLKAGAIPVAQSSLAGEEPAGDGRTVNWGNVLLAGIALALLLGGSGFVVWNERVLRLAPASGPGDWNTVIRARPELDQLMSLLSKADDATVQVIARTLADRPAAEGAPGRSRAGKRQETEKPDRQV